MSKPDDDTLLAIGLTIFNLLNLGDLFWTVRAVGFGALEVNPVLAALLTFSPLAALSFKMAVGVFFASVVWSFRQHRKIVGCASLGLCIYTLLFIYHIYGSIAFLG